MHDQAVTKTLTKAKRIQKRRDFLRVQRYGIRSFGKFVVAIAHRNKEKGAGKVGLTVPKKVGPAHVRNKIKRRMRHVLRLNQDLFADIFLVVIAKESANSASFLELKQDLEKACYRFRSTKVNSPHQKQSVKFIELGVCP